MSDDEIMAAVWAAPDCPVQLADPDAYDVRGNPRPWPRERLEVQAVAAAAANWDHRCGCRGDHLHAIDDATVRVFRQTLVAMSSRRWASTDGVDVRVHLGQCADCGRVYWGIRRP